jgi:small conductance mechanosensitive channel
VSEYLSRENLISVATILGVAAIAYPLILAATSQLRRLAVLERDPARKARREQRAETLRSIVNNFVRIAMIIAVGAMLLRKFGVDATPILAGAGVVGIALGFGAQSLVRDYLAGAFIIIENQYDIGDQVTMALLHNPGRVGRIRPRPASGIVDV